MGPGSGNILRGLRFDPEDRYIRSPDIDVRLRCIGKLPANNNVYMLEISMNYANITVNDVDPDYLKSRHFYAKDELGGGV